MQSFPRLERRQLLCSLCCPVNSRPDVLIRVVRAFGLSSFGLARDGVGISPAAGDAVGSVGGERVEAVVAV
jgi:hypothetical protein